MSKEPICIMRGKNGEVWAWWNHGSHSFPLDDLEKKLSDEQIVDLITNYLVEVKVRCTVCTKDLFIREIAGYPLFAGVACKDCWKEHLEILDKQVREGNVCRMCGEPRGACCC